MENADMTEVFKRLGEQAKPLFDEGHRPLPIPSAHQIPEPLFLTPREDYDKS
jgi:hypothetical protein